MKLAVISDIHYYSPLIGTSGEAYEAADFKSQKLLAGAKEVIEAAFEQLKKDETEYILISGDTTNDGEMSSHLELIERLRSLKAAGKKVYVITATHDYHQDGFAKGYRGAEIIKLPAPRREELFEMYREFGADEAISVSSEFMSYVVQLPDNIRLFALNDDMGFSDEMMLWISERAKEARLAGQTVVAMTHHPLIAPSPVYELVGKGDMHRGYRERRKELADMGIEFIFTGHTHTQNIGRAVSDRGNVLYAINTASLIGYPAPIRRFEINSNTASLKTEHITEKVNFDFGGKSLEDELKRKLSAVISAMLTAAGEDTPTLAKMVNAISIKPSVAYKFGWLIRPPVKWLNRVRFKTFASWTRAETGLSKEETAAFADEKVVDFIKAIAANLFAGERLLEPEDPKNKVFFGFLSLIDGVLRALHIDLGKILKVAPDVTGLLGQLSVGGEIDAFNCELELFPFVPEGEKREVTPLEASFPCVKKSKKGVAIIVVGVLLLLILLPLLLLYLLIGFVANRIRFRKELK